MKKLTTTMMQETLNKQDGRLTVGLDLGDRSSFYCVLDGTGDVLLEQGQTGADVAQVLGVTETICGMNCSTGKSSIRCKRLRS